MKKTFGSLIAIALLLLSSHGHCAEERPSNRCITGATCSADGWASDSLWIAQEIIDGQAATISKQKLHLLEACFLLMTSEIALHIFEKETTTKQAYSKKVESFSATVRNPKSPLRNELFTAFAGCPEGTVSSDEFSEFLTSSLLLRRPLTDLSEFRANPRFFEGRTLRFSGTGKYVLGTFLLQSAPGDLSPVRVDTSELSSDNKADLVKQCSNIKQQCRITVWAKSWPDQAATDLRAVGTIEFNK